MAWALGQYRGVQAGLVAAICATVFFRVFPVEMQKRIINEAVALRLEDRLILYSALYLLAVVTASLLKYLINVIQGWLGQRLLQDIRDELYNHIVRLPLPFFRDAPAGMVVSSLTSELAGVGDFLGAAVAVPVITLLTLLAFAGYMFWLDPLLACLSLAVYPVEMAIIPRLQRRLNSVNRKRIDVTRTMATAVGEAVTGMHEIHANAAYGLEGRKFGGISHRLFRLRHRMNLWNYGIKLANNLFQKIGPFLLFLVGGYLAITGRFSLGSLVAFLSAYDNLYDPWRELMDYYQTYQDSTVRYRRVMEYFDAEPDVPAGAPESAAAPPAVPADPAAVEIRNVSYVAEGGARLLDSVSLTLAPGEQLAVVGPSGSGKSTLALVLGQLYRYSTGSVLMDGRELKNMSKEEISLSVGFVSQIPYIFGGSLRDNLLYGARAVGRTVERGNLLEALDKVGLREDVIRLGLASRLGPIPRLAPDGSALSARLVAVRRRLRRTRIAELEALVEAYVPDRYLHHGDVLTNIIFGEALDPSLAPERAPADPAFVSFLRDRELYKPLLALGAELAGRTVGLLRDLGDDAFFFQGSPIPAGEIDEYADLVERLRLRGTGAPGPADELALLGLALRFVPARHKMISLPSGLEHDILAARYAFIESFGSRDVRSCILEDQPAQAEQEFPVAFFCPGAYINSLTLLENILYGRVRPERAGGQDRAERLAVEALTEEGLLDEILELGMDFDVGSKGDRLSGGQRQKVALARALLKRPRLLILDEATAGLDNASQARVQELLTGELKGRCTVVAILHRLDVVRRYDRIIVIKSGRIDETGTWDELSAAKGTFHRLLRGQA